MWGVLDKLKSLFFSSTISYWPKVTQDPQALTQKWWMFPMFWCECECRLIETRWHALDLTLRKACQFKFSPNLTNQNLASHNGLQSQNSLRNMCLDWPNDILHVINFLLDSIYHYREPVWEFDTTFTRHRVVAFFETAFAWGEKIILIILGD